ncbi:uncharacterized protein LOC142098451 [Mixophyes fleayi]|uniref:uncharacterized protein LOC142098451 n=1 Tax=Mixophyes fleayi TaxID=3061075 RepID=UPI003F4DB4F5
MTDDLPYLSTPVTIAKRLCASGAALEVSAPTSHKVQAGLNFILPCTFTVNNPTVNPQFLAIIWQFQEKMIIRMDTKGLLSDGRKVINKQDISKGIADLHIQNVTISDIGTYKCMVTYSPDTKFKDIKLTVYAPPAITHLEKVIGENEQNRFICSVAGFYPIDITVELLMDREVIEGSVTSSHMNDDGTFSINNTVIIPSEEKPQVLSCRVRHESLTADLQQDLLLEYNEDNNSNVGMVMGIVIAVILLILLIIAVFVYKKKSGFQKMVVSNIQGATWVDGEKTTLFCTASNCIQDTLVMWIIKNKDGTMCEVSESPAGDIEEEQPLMSREYKVTMEKIPSQKKKGLYDVTTELTFIPSISRHIGANVTCRIVSKKRVDEKTYEYKSIHAKPTLIEPIQFTLSKLEDVQLSAGLQGFYPKIMQITWVSKKAQSEDKITSQEEIMNNTDATFNLKSKCTVPGELFKDPTYKVIVTWKHESMDVSQSRELSGKDLPWQPQIQDHPIESVFQDDEVHLRCTVSDYFPDALTVKWFEKKKGSEELIDASHCDKYTIPKITSNRTENKTFTSRALLSFKKCHLSEKAVMFICRVEHPSLETPIQSSTQMLRDTDQDFIVNNIQGPQTWYDGEKVTLYCAALYCTEDTKVTWFVTQKDGTVHKIPTGEDIRRYGPQSPGYLALRERTDMSDIEGLLDITTSLSFTPSISEHKKITVGCKIVSGGRTKEKTFQRNHLFAKPKVVNPIRLSLTDLGEVLCSLDIDGIYPKDIQIKWNNTETLNSDKVTNTDGICNVHSEYKIPGSFFKDPKSTVTVSWKHESMEGWESRQVSVLDKEFPWKPEVQDIAVPNLLIGSTATLRCEVSNVFPDGLNVRWLKKERHGQEISLLVPSDKYSISETKLEKQKDNTFTYKTCLKFNPSINAEEGAEFICRVEHPSLEKPTEKSTGPLCIKDIKNITPMSTEESPTDSSLQTTEDVTTDLKATIPQKEESEPLTCTFTCKDNEDGSCNIMSICDLIKATSNLDKWSVLQATVEHETLDSTISKSIKKITPMSTEESPTDSSLQTLENVTTDLKTTIPQIGFPVVKDIVCTGEGIYSLAVDGIYPQKSTILWKLSVQSSTEESEPLISTLTCKDNEEGSYQLTSICDLSKTTIDLDKWNVLQATVEHETLDSPISKSIDINTSPLSQEKSTTYSSLQTPEDVTNDLKATIPQKDDQQIFIVGDIHGPNRWTHGEKITLYCSVSYCPEDVNVIWTVTERDGKQVIISSAGEKSLREPEALVTSGYFLTTETDKSDKEGLFHVTSLMTLIPSVSKHVGTDLTCKIISNGQTKIKKFQPKSIYDYPWRPEMVISVPSLRINEEASLQCTISKYFPNALSVMWFRKDKASGEMCCVSSNGTYKVYNNDLGRQTDNTYSGISCLSFIPTLETGDGAEFICRVEHPSLVQPMERSTGALQITAKPVPDDVRTSLCNSGDVLCSLDLHSVYPKQLHLKWTTGQTHLPSTEEWKENTDNIYTVYSQCMVPGHLFMDPSTEVCVTWKHKSMDKPESRVLSGRDLVRSWHPEIQAVPIPHVIMGKQTSLQYNISKYFPDALSVRWYKKEEGGQIYNPISDCETYKMSVTKSQRQPDNTYCCTASLVITASLRDQGSDIICRVEHPSLEKSIERSSGPLLVMAQPVNRNPVKRSLGKQEVNYSLILENFYPKEIHIQWCYGSGEKVTQTCASKEQFIINPDKTFSIISECGLSENLLNSPDVRVRVTWTHESMDDAGFCELSLTDKDYPWCPEMEILVPHLKVNEEASLQCTISNYFPNALFVIWLRKDKLSGETRCVSSNGKYKVSHNDLGRQTDNTYSCKSSLSMIHNLETEHGAEFICRVEHPSLVQPMERSTGSLQITGIA